MNSNNKTTFPTIGILAIGLVLMFTYFKITGELDWSWLMVFAPLWVPILIIIAIVLLLIIGMFTWIAVENIIKSIKQSYKEKK